jgi:hypothetical protein
MISKAAADWWLISKSYKLLLVLGICLFVTYFILTAGMASPDRSSGEAAPDYLSKKKPSPPILLDKLKNPALGPDKGSYGYSVWPSFLDTRDLVNFNQTHFLTQCCDSVLKSEEMSIDNMHKIMRLWAQTTNEKCKLFHRLFSRIYELKYKESHLQLDGTFTDRVAKMLGNNPELLKTVYNQVINLFFSSRHGN